VSEGEDLVFRTLGTPVLEKAVVLEEGQEEAREQEGQQQQEEEDVGAEAEVEEAEEAEEDQDELVLEQSNLQWSKRESPIRRAMRSVIDQLHTDLGACRTVTLDPRCDRAVAVQINTNEIPGRLQAWPLRRLTTIRRLARLFGRLQLFHH
jgi:hypothetical protein